MSLIEQAARRLQQLRQAGVNLPGLKEPVPEKPSGPLITPGSSLLDSAAAPLAEPVAPARGGAAPAAEPTLAREPAPIVVETLPQSRRVDLDLDAIAASGIASPNAPRSRIAEEYRVIKRPLITNAMGKGVTPVANGNLIMVTSAMPGEGKSFTAINLAMSIAMELDNTVMLVDADVARPSILNMLGLPPAPGLLDVLLDNSVDLSKVLLRTNVEKLTLLPSGTRHQRATELLASDAMGSLLDDMSRRYSDRIIIFDSPPLLITTEARVLASHMGQIVVVVQAEKTLRNDLMHALATIEECPLKMTLLNQARGSTADGYGYGYAYGYGQGA